MRALLIGAVGAIALAFAGTAQAQADADVSLVHGIPDTPVDVVVDGTVLIDGFEPGSLADLSEYAGELLQNVTVNDDATDDVLIGPIAEFAVPASGSWSIAAHLDAMGEPVLTPFENDVSPAAEGEGRLTVRHTAAAGPIDVVVGDQRPITDAANGDSAVLEVPAGTISDAQIAPTGEDPIAEIAPIDVAAGTNTVLYAIGSVDDDTLDVIQQVLTLSDPASDTTTTVSDGSTTTTDPNATTTTTDPNATTTDPAATTTTAVPTGVNTGSPLGDQVSTTLLVVVVVGGVVGAGALAARRRV